MKTGFELYVTHNRATAYVFREDGKRLGEITTNCVTYTMWQIREQFPEATEIISKRGRVRFMGTDVSFQSCKWTKMLLASNQ